MSSALEFKKGFVKLNKLVIVILVVAVAWGYYSKSVAIKPTQTSSKNDVTISTTNKQNNYQCDGRQHCSQMSSYEEAKYFIENCPDTKMDGDNDGIPCERQFNR